MSLAVGQNCVWYPHAEVNQNPQAAIVTEVKQPGVYVMYVFPKGGGMPVQKSNVHHIDADYLAENQQMRILYGGWDTVESAEMRRMNSTDERRQRAREAEVESKTASRKEQESVRASVLFDRGFSTEEIAKKLGGDWTEESVSSAIEEQKDAQPA